MRTVLWVIQANLGNADTLKQLRAAFQSLSLEHQEVNAIPFSDELPDISWKGPCVFYGATGFVHKAWTSRRWRPCAFFDEKKFRFSYWQQAWARHLLNDDAENMTLGEFAASKRDPSSLWFIRPDRDSKVFAGEVLSFGELYDWTDRLSAGGFTFGSDEPIVVASPKNIEREWRLFLVEGKVVAASQYRQRQRLTVLRDTPADVREFAEARAAECDLERAFVLDIAQTSLGLRVIEANCINSAGFYAADIQTIIAEITNLAARNNT